MAGKDPLLHPFRRRTFLKGVAFGIHRRSILLGAILGVAVVVSTVPPLVGAAPSSLPAPTGVRLQGSARDVTASWDAYHQFPNGTKSRGVEVERDGVVIGTVGDPSTSFVDRGAPPGSTYRVRARAQRGDGGPLLFSNWVTATGHVPSFLVGAAAFTLNPTPAVAPPDGQVFLGGYGLGAGRRSNGIVGSGAWARAFVVDNGTDAVALVESDNQGTFASYELTRPAAGTIDIAKAAQAATNGGIEADHIVIASDHSHAGQDLIGVWGGVPNEYLEYVKQQTTAAIVTAYDRREFADLSVGAVGGIVAGDASDVLNSQFDDSSCTPDPTPGDPEHTTLPCSEPGDYPQWDLVDGTMRVLHATRTDGSTVAAFVNFPAHSTVMGSGNHGVSGDWPTPTAEKIEAALGGTAVVMPAANGRTQPDRGGGSETEKLDRYSTIVSGIALQAIDAAVPVQGNVIRAKKRLIFEAADNAGLLALLFAGQGGCAVNPAVCVPIMRAKTPPWQSGNVIGTVVSALRVGDVLFTGTPGEPYPQIGFGIQGAVDTGTPGAPDISHDFVFSLADDQLGYLIAPTEGLPAAAESTALTGNDNFLFNIAAPIGDHVMCTAIDLALDIGFAAGSTQDMRCGAWASEPDINPVTQQPN